MKKKTAVLLLILAVAAGLVFWFFYPLRSYAVMSVYSGMEQKESVMRASGFTIKIPSGKGWYPFVMTYNADGFSAWSGIDADMSILYNFGAFDAITRTSSLYDTGGSRYSSFYGAYVVKQRDGGLFGFSENGEIAMDEVMRAVKYDYTQLVLAAFGCREQTFDVSVIDVQKDRQYADSGGWTRIDADIRTNGVAHRFAGGKTPYLQYGRPMQAVDEDFSVTDMYGRVYAKYFEQYGCTVMIYVIAPGAGAADDCDQNVLEKTQISGS